MLTSKSSSSYAASQDQSVEPGFGERLIDAYREGGAAWTEHKAASQRVLPVLREVLGYQYGSRTAACSTTLTLRRSRDGELSVRPFETCKKRWCPVCAWRRSLKQWALLVERLPTLIEQHGPVRWVLLTLTVRNCALDDLKPTVAAMQKGFRALYGRHTKLGQQWPATAWLKALEITFPRPGEAHPHFHILLAVRPSYFSHGYVTQAEWVTRWRKAMKLDYDPVVDVRRVKPLAGADNHPLMEALGGLREVAKYVTKPADVQSNPDALRGLLALRHVRFIDGGGWLRGVLRDGDDDEQLELPEVEDVAVFWWRAVEMQYRRKLGA